MSYPDNLPLQMIVYYYRLKSIVLSLLLDLLEHLDLVTQQTAAVTQKDCWKRFWVDRALILIMTNCLTNQHFSYSWPFCSWNKVIYVLENCLCALIWFASRHHVFLFQHNWHELNVFLVIFIQWKVRGQHVNGIFFLLFCMSIAPWTEFYIIVYYILIK